MVNMDEMETLVLVDCQDFPDHVVHLESLDYPDQRDIEDFLVSLASLDNLVLMDPREQWVIWDPLEHLVNLETVVPQEREEDLELLDQLVFVV